MLTLARNEAVMPVGYYVVDRICDRLNLPVPSVKRVIGALKKEGFQAVQTLSNSRGIKTEAQAKKVQEAVQGMAHANR
jgi:tRNA G26 N,N-dimethylase Trm1